MMVEYCLHVLPGILTQDHVGIPIKNHWVVTGTFLMIWIFCCIFSVGFSLKHVQKYHEDVLLRGREIWLLTKLSFLRVYNGPHSVQAIMQLESDCVMWSRDASCIGWDFLKSIYS